MLNAKNIPLLSFSFLQMIDTTPINKAIPPNAHSIASERFIFSKETAIVSAQLSLIPLSADIAVPITTVIIAAFFHFFPPSGFLTVLIKNTVKTKNRIVK